MTVPLHRGQRPLRPPRGDSGQLTLLVVGFTVIIALLVTVVVNTSRVFLTQRALSAAADGAALAGADALDEAAFYSGEGGGAGDLLPLGGGVAQEAVGAYAASAGLAARFDGFAIATAVAGDGTAVTVTASAVVPLPFVNAVSADWAAGVPLSVTATARSPLTP